MPHTVVIEPYASRDGWGKPTYGAGVTVKARVQGKNRMVRTRDNVEAASMTQIYIGTTPSVGPDDRITLPSGFSPSQPPILSVQKVSDEGQLHHQVIYC